MKTIYETVFAAHVTAKATKAVELGMKASWTTANHLDALASAIEVAIFGEHRTPNSPAFGQIRDCLGECYNVSAFQQQLAKKFEKTGHFQRESGKSSAVKLDDLLTQLAASISTPPAPKSEEKKEGDAS